MIRFKIERWGIEATITDGAVVETTGSDHETQLIQDLLESEPSLESYEPDRDLSAAMKIGRVLRSEISVLEHDPAPALGGPAIQ